MLGLKLPTDPRWVDLAEMSLEDILSDHAYCEQKAAISCISLIQGFPDMDRIVDELSPIVQEEWSHFQLVLNEMTKRKLKLGFQRKDEYVNKLRKFQKKGGGRKNSLIERLLTFALIEARSCERFRLLSLHISEEPLKEFYHGFMVSEAGHYRLFLDLAKYHGDENATLKRWQEYLDYEKIIMNELTLRGDRIH